MNDKEKNDLLKVLNKLEKMKVEPTKIVSSMKNYGIKRYLKK
jgi:hypothetical protein